MFNDLVIHPGGDIYITDTLGGAIFRIAKKSDSLEKFFKNKLLTGPNGITLSEDTKTIFSTSSVGIFKIGIADKSIILLTEESDFHTYGLDGLYFKDNYLYAVQNELLTQVSRFCSQ